MTPNERKLINAAESLAEALERCIRWFGTGGVQQQRASRARDKALARWLTLVRKIQNESKRLTKIERRLDALENPGVALTAASHPSDSLISLEAELEQRLVDIEEAKDGHGRMIMLVSWGNITPTDYPAVHATLKKAYDRLTDSWRLDTAYLPEDTGEEAFWRNVALLTNALRVTSTLIRRSKRLVVFASTLERAREYARSEFPSTEFIYAVIERLRGLNAGQCITRIPPDDELTPEQRKLYEEWMKCRR